MHDNKVVVVLIVLSFWIVQCLEIFDLLQRIKPKEFLTFLAGVKVKAGCQPGLATTSSTDKYSCAVTKSVSSGLSQHPGSQA